MLEQSVEDYLVARVERAGGITAKMTIKGRRGWPDRLVILNGQHLVEVKRPKGGRLSEVQLELGKKLHDNGAKIWLVWSHADVDGFIADAIRMEHG